ncbi:MAG: putative integral membrane protein [Candidatus Accumulibacter adjunctus]|uniref:Integral membrane protein n=1 Tax=Candidatus Accumulibacter adjunctus TaxID=1454001 RepID=A0A011NLS7_9PROT|nr:MAG: putative integral membrane protein [Candidatus Accumulibacter adjunctus]
MSHNDSGQAGLPASHFPVIRSIDAAAIPRWLAAGWRDCRRAGGASVFYGICFAAAGWLMYFVFAEAYALFAGLTTGFLLVGPFLAIGLYDLSRRIERGEPPRLGPTLAAWRANLPNVGLFAALLTIVLLIWARASMVVFALFFTGGLPTFADVVQSVLTFEQPEFSLVYFAVGGFFAAFVFGIGAISLPLMFDRKTDAVTAAIASLVVCGRNPGPMLLWAGSIVLLVGIGFATLFTGLVIATPLVGHATWHAYRDLVAEHEDAVPAAS